LGGRIKSVFNGDEYGSFFLAEGVALAGTDDERRAARDSIVHVRADLSGDHMTFTYEGTRLRLLGLLDASLGDFAAAEMHLREAHSLAQTRRHAPWVAQIAYELSIVLRRMARDPEANAFEAEAQSLASRLGMPGLVDKLGMSEPVHAEKRTRSNPAEPVVVERSGGIFRISVGSRAATVKDSRGMQLLARLIERPNEEIHVLALASDAPSTSVSESHSGELLDETARHAYRKRLADLEELISEAERLGDASRASRLQNEKDALVAELSRAVGRGGRVRQAGSTTERARVNAQRRLKDAIARIREADMELGQFFERSLRTGTFCCFRQR
jgi:hypothetical protein